ncbi:EpsD family peptidyl-prolyl cis-trans isomerase [Azohydromonas caseinilytica]|uniref:Peptidyl-prolyl cis-trans isomerase, EpsD family n=1 Tax=Azohydromonas caseinilytica TaxID=2728836 RepID=A0A848FH56_9BURK|nr:EpsD family peptidyl-prolyl cis-trans isomerase [Azohydromonas caseinilytica]NML17530.1 peptidyl-prolyl cis-trans isomerase, EpsD family [Azohydromonas caseinilytica]
MSPLMPRAVGQNLLRAVVMAPLLLGLLAACGDKKDKPATQVAARVNDKEISVHQLNYVLQQQDVRQDSVEAASRQVLDRLIDQELALQKALDLKIDRQPAVLQALEAAKRDVLARAYLERVAEAAAKPTAAEVEKFYKDKPALFSERRIYQLHEINIQVGQDRLPEVGKRLSAAKDLGEFTKYLQSSDIRFVQNRAVRAAEQLPLEQLDEFARMNDGQARLIPTANGAIVIALAGSQSQPVSLEKARPAIDQYLSTQRKRELVERDIKDLRSAAKIELVGKFAEKPQNTGGNQAANGPGETDTSNVPAAGPGASSIDHGLGVNK